MQAQATQRLRTFRFNRLILGAIIGLGVVAASVFATQALIEEQAASDVEELSPALPIQADPPLADDWVDPYFVNRTVKSVVQADPPLPAGWIDPYFINSTAGSFVHEDPPLPDGWVDPYFTQGQAAIPAQQDPPLPEGWIDPYFQGH